MLKQHLITTMTITLMLLCNSLLADDTVIDKRLNYQIIIPDKPTAVQRFAASELKKFLQKTYTQAIKLNGNTDDVTFIVGTSTKKISIDFTNLPNLENKFGIFRNKNKFLFIGDDFPELNPKSTPRRQAGTLTAVYYFLNKYANVNFYFPGQDGYSLSANQALLFKGTEDIPTPSFEVRSVSMQNQGYTAKESILFLRRSLGNLPYWGRHDFYYMFINKWKKRFKKTHPEYFGLYDGKRVSKKYPYHLPCFSNPAVMKQVVDDIVLKIKANPNIKTVRIFADCPAQFCKCEKCMAMKERRYIEETKKNGEMVYGIVKRIMDEVHKIYPDTQFLTQTKKYTGSGSYFRAPKLIKLGPQCTVEHLTERALPNKNHTDDVVLTKRWNENGVKIVLKSYERFSTFKNYPIIKPHLDQKFLKLFEGKTTGTRYSGTKKSVPYSFCALNEYLQFKLLFNIDTDIDAETANFCAFAYPGATKEMLAFYQKMEELFAKLQGRSKPLLGTIYTAEKLTKPMQLLDKAAKKIKPNSKYFQRLYSDFKKFYTKAKEHPSVH